MSWSISASGHTHDEGIERELADRLSAAVSEIAADPKYGISSFYFGGSYVHGDLRTREGWLKPAEEEPA